MYWTQFPNELHPETMDVAMAALFQRESFDLDKAALVGTNAIGYGYAKARGIPVLFGSGPLDEETVRNTIEAAMAPDEGLRGAIPWALLIQIGMAILEAIKNRP